MNQGISASEIRDCVDAALARRGREPHRLLQLLVDVQRAGIIDESTGSEFEVMGIGGSWFGLARVADGEDAGQIKIAWQRDWFDLGSTAHTFLAVAGSGQAPQAFLDRISLNGRLQPGHYPYAELPATVWPPHIEQD